MDCLHEAGDVAVRVTSEGLTHHHTDHAGGDATFINMTEVIAHRNVRENVLATNNPAPRA